MGRSLVIPHSAQAGLSALALAAPQKHLNLWSCTKPAHDHRVQDEPARKGHCHHRSSPGGAQGGAVLRFALWVDEGTGAGVQLGWLAPRAPRCSDVSRAEVLMCSGGHATVLRLLIHCTFHSAKTYRVRYARPWIIPEPPQRETLSQGGHNCFLRFSMCHKTSTNTS